MKLIFETEYDIKEKKINRPEKFLQTYNLVGKYV